MAGAPRHPHRPPAVTHGEPPSPSVPRFRCSPPRLRCSRRSRRPAWRLRAIAPLLPAARGGRGPRPRPARSGVLAAVGGRSRLSLATGAASGAIAAPACARCGIAAVCARARRARVELSRARVRHGRHVACATARSRPPSILRLSGAGAAPADLLLHHRCRARSLRARRCPRRTRPCRRCSRCARAFAAASPRHGRVIAPRRRERSRPPRRSPRSLRCSNGYGKAIVEMNSVRARRGGRVVRRRGAVSAARRGSSAPRSRSRCCCATPASSRCCRQRVFALVAHAVRGTAGSAPPRVGVRLSRCSALFHCDRRARG